MRLLRSGMPLDLDTDNSEGHGQSYKEGERDYVWT